MSEGKPMNRWLVVLGAIVIQLALGAIYAWSVFTSFGVGGIVGPIVAGKCGDYARASGEISLWLMSFVIVGAACFLAAGLALALRPPHHRNA